MRLDPELRKILENRLEPSELVDVLGVSIEDLLDASLDFEWINEANLDDLKEYVNYEE